MPIYNRLGKYVVNFFEWDERMKKRWFLLICCMLCLIFPGCNSQKYERYRGEFYGTFDTVVTIVGYVQKERDFDRYLSYAQERFQYFHQLFDRYEAYTDVTNIKTINDNAGISPVKVSKGFVRVFGILYDVVRKKPGTGEYCVRTGAGNLARLSGAF